MHEEKRVQLSAKKKCIDYQGFFEIWVSKSKVDILYVARPP